MLSEANAVQGWAARILDPLNVRALKILAATKLLPLLLLALPAVAQAQYFYTNSYGIWSYTPNTGPVTITGDTNIPLNGVVVIPDTINGYPVTSIGNSAFYDLTSLTNVTIPNSVTNIGNSAFALCTGLKGVTIGTNVTSIGSFAFGACFSLTSVTIPDSATIIGGQAFFSCIILTNVIIGKGVTSIGAQAFYDCASLMAITVDAANASYITVAGVLFNKSQTTLVQYPGGKVGSYSISNGVTSIGSSAFAACASLTGITIPGSVTSIGSAAFDDCNGLTGVSIPGSVTSIGLDAFAACTSLMTITVDATDASYSSVAGILFNKSQSTLIQYPNGRVGSYSISNNVTSIGSDAFYDSASLTGVSIPNSVTSIGTSAFNQCASLTSVTIPDNVTSLGSETFGFCTSLTNVTIGSSVNSIASYAFYGCTKLTRVYCQWNSPTPTNDLTVFSGDPATVYYVPGTAGWGPTFDGLPTAPWFLPNPQILTGNNPGFGVQSNGFGFIISWLTNISVVVEASTNLANPVWSPVSTNTFTGGTSYFSDPQWTNYPARFYRLSWQ